MAKYIDKKEAMRRLKAAYDGSVFTHGDEDNLFADGLEYAIAILDSMPVAGEPSARCGKERKDFEH